MRTLILTGPASEEQQAVAQALKSALSARGDTSLCVGAHALIGPHAPLSMTAALEEEALLSPRAFSFLAAGDLMLRGQRRRRSVYEVNARYAENLRTLLTEGDFDAVLCLHRYPAEAVAQLRGTVPSSARCCFVGADFSVVPFLEETALDLFFLAHEDLRAPYERRGLPGGRIAPVGIPLPAAWFREEAREDARALLNLPHGAPCYYIHTADPEAATAALLSRLNGSDARICVRIPDAARRSSYSARFAGDIRISAVPPEESAALCRIACDVMLAAPSGAIPAAAAVCGTPLVLLPPADALETQNARFFAARGMAAAAETLDGAAAIALALAKDASSREKMCQAQWGRLAPDAADRVVQRLHEG